MLRLIWANLESEPTDRHHSEEQRLVLDKIAFQLVDCSGCRSPATQVSTTLFR